MGHSSGAIYFAASDDWYANSTIAAECERKIRRIQQKALQIAQELEAYPARYPRDVYFAGYALLYATILRMHWEEHIEPIAERFKTLEILFQLEANPVPATMAAWYRALLLAQEHRQEEALREMARIRTEYGPYDFALVKYAQDIEEKPEILQNLCQGFFHTPIHDPSRFRTSDSLH